MLYPESQAPFSQALFENPSAIYRGTPFWAWNNEITVEEIDRQIEAFHEMGLGGFHVHVRTGLKNNYMDEAFLDLVGHCIEKAKEYDMLCWLYDEDRWSSGFAGGIVTKTIRFRIRSLHLTKEENPEFNMTHEEFLARTGKNENLHGCLITCYDIHRERGCIISARQIPADSEAEYEKWYLYEEIDKESQWRNNQTYVDTLNPEAIEAFIASTHQKYYDRFGDEFGKTVPAIFTDEPSYPSFIIPSISDSDEDSKLPYTDGLEEEFKARFGADMFDAIPYVIWNRPSENTAKERFYYYETVTKRFSESFWGTIGRWCDAHGLNFTGHQLSEENLEVQSRVNGDAMRGYIYEQIPGIDMLVDKREFSTAKQCQSVKHQSGREGMMSELFGVTQWDFRHEGYKLGGDWQAALGVTVQVPHLAWFSMNGEAKRDYPAAIGYQSPWYKNYKFLADHFARTTYLMTRGTPFMRVGVLHPEETYWLFRGPMDQNGILREQLETDFRNVTTWLLTGGIDFDFISQGLLQEFEGGVVEKNGRPCMKVGKMAYETIVVPDALNLRRTTLEALYEFSGRGGKVFFCGMEPETIDLEKPEGDAAESLQKLLEASDHVRLGRAEVLSALKDYQEVDIINDKGQRRPHFLYQMREEGDARWLFISQAYYDARKAEGLLEYPRHPAEKLTIRVKGSWSLEVYDTVKGTVSKLPSYTEDDETVFLYDMFADDSLLLRLLPRDASEKNEKLVRKPEATAAGRIGTHGENNAFGTGLGIKAPAAYHPTEKNALLLDSYEYRFEKDAAWSEPTEALRTDDVCRERFDFPFRAGSVEQPYIGGISDTYRPYYVGLRVKFHSDIVVKDALLAMEDPQYSDITLNGEKVSKEDCGYYVDRAIRLLRLPEIRIGENELLLDVQYGYHAYIERMYILGDFGVSLIGTETKIVEKPEKLYFGDYTLQGYPFYTGNMEYEFNVESDGEAPLSMYVPYFGGVGLLLSTNGGEEENISLLPYRGSLKGLEKGMNKVKVTVLGHRYNGFGQVHLIGDDINYLSPSSWRTSGDSWSDSYQVKPMGILAPVIIQKL